MQSALFGVPTTDHASSAAAGEAGVPRPVGCGRRLDRNMKSSVSASWSYPAAAHTEHSSLVESEDTQPKVHACQKREEQCTCGSARNLAQPSTVIAATIGLGAQAPCPPL
ncbi:uncharacterized protein LOC144104440 [Amblyomma americanum]